LARKKNRLLLGQRNFTFAALDLEKIIVLLESRRTVAA